MKKVTLVNTNGDTKEISVRFSFGYFFFGPLYHFFKVMIVRGLLLSILYFVVIYRDLMRIIKDLLVEKGINPESLKVMDFVYDRYCWLLGVLGVVHILLALITPRMVIKKSFRQGYVPYSEIDTQLLIKHNLAKVGTLCYLSSFKSKDGVQGKIKMGNSKDLQKELDELKQLLKEGMLTKDEYETKRAQAIMRSGSKK